MRVRYDDADKIPAMTAEITELLKAHPGIDSVTRPIRVHLRGIKDDHLSVRVGPGGYCVRGPGRKLGASSYTRKRLSLTLWQILRAKASKST